MFKSAFLFSLLLSVQVTAYSFSSDTLKTYQFGLFLSFSDQSLDIAELNSQLIIADKNPLDEGLFGITLGMTYQQVDKSSYGIAKITYYDSFEQQPREGTKTQLNVWEFSHRSVWDVLQTPNWLLYPYIDIGLQIPKLTISTATDNRSFSQSLASTDESEIIHQKYQLDRVIWLGEMGIGLERKFSFDPVVVFFGLAGGYQISTGGEWQLSRVKTYPSSPAFNTRGLSFELLFRVALEN